MAKRIISITLIILHIVTFGPIRDAFAFNASSASYDLTSGSLNEGGKNRSASSIDTSQDTIGEAIVGESQSTSYILNSGYIATIQSNPPIQTQIIPNQTWQENTSNPDTFDLDNYFLSPDGLGLSYSVSGNSNIIVTIDPVTHIVSFSQPQAWFGVEKIRFTAIDTEYKSLVSNEVTLQVQGVDNAPVLDFIPDITADETDLVQIIPNATDLDGDPIAYSFTLPLDSQGKWQTDYDDAGIYNVTVTAEDPTNLTDTQDVKINVRNVNRPPTLNPIPDITEDEGSLVTVSPVASDPDGDALSFYYSSPLDSTGKWLTNYDDAGTYTAQVTASDGIDTATQPVKIIINNVNRPPEVILTLSKYTVNPNEEFHVNLLVNDPDGDSMTFSIEKDGVEFTSGSIVDSYSMQTSFSSIGDHTVSAVVLDAGALSTTAAKGVDVVDPNTNRNSINPVMGDFNGDCLSDLGLHNSDTGTWEICLSDKGVFNNAVDWLVGFGTSRDYWPISGDFNGDGKTDIGTYNNRDGELQVATSSGSNFTSRGTWFTFSEASYSWQGFTGNFNADRYTDFALYNKDTGEVRIAKGTGPGFGAITTWASNAGTGYIALTGDFNGDSISDLCLFDKSQGEFKIVFSNTSAFVDEAVWINGFAQDKSPIISDFNNDGLTDVGYWDKDTQDWYYAISTGDAFIDKGIWASYGTSIDESASTGDFNGDGVTDLATFDRDEIGINRWRVQLSNRNSTDLLVEIDNGIGGKTQITYTYASQFENDLLPFPVYVASSTSLVNTEPIDRQATYTQNFEYSGGYFDAQEREFRGFNKVKVIDPITDNFTETYFYQGKPGQDGALKGRIEKVIAYDGNNRKISETVNTYEVKKSGSESNVLGFPSLKETHTTVWEEDDSSLTIKTAFKYDNIGNVIEQSSDIGNVLDSGGGSINVNTGDEKIGLTEYAQAYELGYNRPLEVVLNDTNGDLISKKNLEYDTKGNLVKEISRLYNPLTDTETDVATRYSYDSFGNLTSSTNPKDVAITTDYETTFYTFPERVTNSLDHTLTYEYDAKFGVVTKVTDPNGNIATTSYDSLCRVTQVKNAYNEIITTYGYPDFNTRQTTQANFTSREFIDGLGRKYKSISPGEDGSAFSEVVTEVFYNERSLVEKESIAHYMDESPGEISYVRYEYDIRGRVKKTIQDFPSVGKDAEASINYINPLYTETIDTKGHKKGALKDIHGNVLEIDEFFTGETGDEPTTTYIYDLQNNLIEVKDRKRNITNIFYDSLGRKIKMIDPDMGEWMYEYDELGNLIRQTDAKDQVLEFEYDALNRLTYKIADGQTIVSYIYDETSKANCIGRLSKITDQSGSTEFFYDKLGRETKSIKTVEGVSYTVERTYDILDRLTELKYPDGETVYYTYDTNSGLLERVEGMSLQGAVPYVQDIRYNALGQIETIQYENDTETTYTYGQDLRLSRIYTEGLSPQGTVPLQDLHYIFDKNGNITTLTDNLRTNVRTFYYDGLDRLTEAQNVPEPGGGYTAFNYQYDSIGNMTYRSDVGVMTYGEIAGPHAVTTAGGYSYEYDENGNMVYGKNKTMAYDAENRLIQVDEFGTVTTFVYDGDGGRVKRIIADENIPSLTINITPTDYIDSSSWLGWHDNPDGSVYTVSEGWLDYSVDFGEDSLPVTLTLSTKNMGILPSTYTHFEVEAYVDNVSKGIFSVPASTTEYQDGSIGLGVLEGEHTIRIKWLNDYYVEGQYDANIQIGSIQFSETTLSGATTYIGSLFEEDSDGKTRKHIFAGANRVCTKGLSPQGTVPEAYYYHSDHLGSSNIITDSTGQLIQYCEYTPYGTLARNEGTDAVTHKFTGKELDASTGLYYYGARYYDPELGRFTQADTLVTRPGDPQDLNRYAYCRNNPLNYVDPTGHGWFKKFWQSIAGVVGIVASILCPAIAPAMTLLNFGISAYTAIDTGNIAGLVGGIVGGAVFGAIGKNLSLGMVGRMGDTAWTFGGGAIGGAVEFGLGGFGAGFVGGLAGGQSFSDSLKAGGLGAAIGGTIGAGIQGSYMAGWQDVAHGFTYAEAGLELGSAALGAGNIKDFARVDTRVRTRTKGRKGLWLHGTDKAGHIGINAKHALNKGSFVTLPFARDPVAGKLAFRLNPREYTAYTGMPLSKGEYLALAIGRADPSGIAKGGWAPEFRMRKNLAVSYKNPNR